MGWLGQHAAGDEEADVVAGFLVRGVRAQPVVEGNGVQFPGLGVRPRLGGADLGGEGIEQGGELVHFGRGGFADREGLARVQGAFAVGADIDGFAVAVTGVGLQAQVV